MSLRWDQIKLIPATTTTAPAIIINHGETLKPDVVSGVTALELVVPVLELSTETSAFEFD